MAKLGNGISTTLKGYFEEGDRPTEAQFAELIQDIQDGIETHQHLAAGGADCGTGDAGPVINLQSGLEEDKPENPEIGDVYVETDTSKVHICFSEGVWTEITNAADMLKSTYDTDDDGVVDDAEKLDGSTKAEVQDHTPKTHGATEHTNVTRELFIPCSPYTNGEWNYANFYPHVILADEAIKAAFFSFKVPDDFVSYGSLKAVWYSHAEEGSMYWRFKANWTASGEGVGQHSEIGDYGQTATAGEGTWNVQEPDDPIAFSNLAKGDYVGVELDRAGDNASDTLSDEAYILGLLFTYTAEQ